MHFKQKKLYEFMKSAFEKETSICLKKQLCGVRLFVWLENVCEQRTWRLVWCLLLPRYSASLVSQKTLTPRLLPNYS